VTAEQSKLLDKTVLGHFPKVELHRHLEGAFPVDKLHHLSLKNNLDRPRDFEDFKREVQFPRDSSPDFLAFLTKFRNDWYRSLDDVYFIAYHAVKELVGDGLLYCELRFSPEHFASVNDFDRREITRLIVEAGNKAACETGLHLRYLLTFNRSKQTAREMVALYDRLKSLELPEIVGIDLAGDEINYPPELFRDFFDRVSADGLFRATVHAGEVTAPTQIWEAIRRLNAARIGHGTSAIDDPILQEHLKERGIALELCITSNYQTGSWADESNHPVGVLFRRGVPVTLNSDDPSIQNTDLTDEYLKAIRYFDFSLEDLVQLNVNALQAAFLSDDERQSLVAEYRAAIDEFKKQYLAEEA
jgi:adenosine deaminase